MSKSKFAPDWVKYDHMPLVRINAEAWAEDPEWVEFVNRPSTATWHQPGEELNEYSDVFFIYADGGATGSDYPDGVPEHIWTEIKKILGDMSQALVWVSTF